MSRKFRTFLFVFFLLVFAVGAPCLVLYAQGYRLNWPPESGKKLLVKTGGFFVKTTPKQASIYINDRLREQTDFIFGSALVENLLPRQYRIEIKKQGYHSWEKTLEIKEKEVTDAQMVTLFPERIGFSTIQKNIKDILPSPDGQKIALRENNESGWSLKLYDIRQNIASELARQSSFNGKNPGIYHWEWQDQKTIAVSISSENATTVYAIDIDKSPARISKDTPKNHATTTEALASWKSGPDQYLLAADGYIYKKNNGNATVKTGAAPIKIEPGKNYSVWVFGDYYFIGNGREIFVQTPDSGQFEKILDGAGTKAAIAPDGQKIAFFSDSEIWLYFLKDKNNAPEAKAGDKVFLARLSEKIGGGQWIDAGHLIFTAGEAVKAAETDNRDKVNIVTLAKFADFGAAAAEKTPQIFWNSDQKTACLFAGGTLYRSQPIQ